jgi:uncharacterized protein
MQQSYQRAFPVEHRLASSGPKRLLAIDGSGARTALALPFLETIESELQSSSRDPKQRLCDYFDLIGGTGAGAVVAVSLARGMFVHEVRGLFQKFTGEFFRTQGILQRFARERRFARA